MPRKAVFYLNYTGQDYFKAEFYTKCPIQSIKTFLYGDKRSNADDIL